jgi:hypothetical protein
MTYDRYELGALAMRLAKATDGPDGPGTGNIATDEARAIASEITNTMFGVGVWEMSPEQYETFAGLLRIVDGVLDEIDTGKGNT